MDSKKKIGLIEDDKILSKNLNDALCEAGFDVFCAFDGEEGLKLIKAKNPDLVLLDIIMPKMDGIELLKNVRESSSYKELPVVLLTNFDADDDLIRKILEYRPSFYLIKSNWEIKDIVEKVKERLNAV